MSDLKISDNYDDIESICFYSDRISITPDDPYSHFEILLSKDDVRAIRDWADQILTENE